MPSITIAIALFSIFCCICCNSEPIAVRSEGSGDGSGYAPTSTTTTTTTTTSTTTTTTTTNTLSTQTSTTTTNTETTLSPKEACESIRFMKYVAVENWYKTEYGGRTFVDYIYRCEYQTPRTSDSSEEGTSENLKNFGWFCLGVVALVFVAGFFGCLGGKQGSSDL